MAIFRAPPPPPTDPCVAFKAFAEWMAAWFRLRIEYTIESADGVEMVVINRRT